MASVSASSASSAGSGTEDSASGNHAAGSAEAANLVADEGSNASNGFPNGDYVTRMLARLSAARRTSLETEATSFDEALARGIAPIAHHPARSPNPLRAPVPSLASVSRPVSMGEAPMPAIAAVRVDTLSTVLFDQDPKFGATAHAIFNITAVPQNASMTDESGADAEQPPAPYLLADNYPGCLVDLEMQTYISGPGVKLVELGSLTRRSLRPGDQWVNIVYLGVKETSLASRLSTSVRSRGNKGSTNSHNKSTTLSLIDQWLDVLKMDIGKKNEAVIVTAVIKHRHTFMPADTWLETRTFCPLDLSPKYDHAAEVREARKGKARARDSEEIYTPETSSDMADLYRHSFVSGVIVRALDPGGENLKLQSTEGVRGPDRLAIRPVDALRLLQHVREAIGFGPDDCTNADLLALNDYYHSVLTEEPRAIERNTLVRSVRHRAQTLVKKLSPKKLAIKSTVAHPALTSPLQTTPYMARQAPSAHVIGKTSESGGISRTRSTIEDEEAACADFTEGRRGTPIPPM
ncbi:hypothetical protein ABEF95_001628 [Exophiala dermatitidis]